MFPPRTRNNESTDLAISILSAGPEIAQLSIVSFSRRQHVMQLIQLVVHGLLSDGHFSILAKQPAFEYFLISENLTVKADDVL